MSDEGTPLTIDVRDVLIARAAMRERIAAEVTVAAEQAGVKKEVLPEIIARGLNVFRDMDQDGRPVGKHGNEILYSKNGIDPMTPKEWIFALRSSGAVPPELWRIKPS